MRRFWQIIALITLVQIVPASACCLLPTTFGAEDTCCTPATRLTAPSTKDAPLPNLPAQPANCPSDTIAHSQLPVVTTLPAAPLVELHWVALAIQMLPTLAPADENSLSFVPTAPPELRASWQFVIRAALPARLPSDRI